MKPIICPMTGINVTSAILAALGAAVALYITDYVLHGVLLMGIYEETANLWRTPEEWQALAPYMLGAYVLIALTMTKLYAIFSHKQECCEGVMFGSIVGVLLGTAAASSYVYMPIPGDLALYWLLGTTVQFAIIGGVIGAIYKKA